MSKVPVQKGKIVADQKTMKTMTHAQKEAEQMKFDRMLKDGQTLKLHTPSKG